MLLGTSSLIFVNLNGALQRGSLIKHVCDRYNSDKVLIILGSNNLLFEKSTIWYGVINTLSNDGISTSIVDFNALNLSLKTVNAKNMHVLIVLVLDTIEELKNFESIAEGLYTSYAIWLILFTSDSSQDLCEFCRKPHGNLSNPKFGQKVLTLCCHSNVIMEWRYSETNRIRRLEVGRLMDGKPGIVWSSDELDHNRKYSMDGKTFRVIGVKTSIMLWEEDGVFSGILGELLTELSQAMNFTLSKIIWEHDYGIWNPKTSNWTGAIGRIHRREADIGVSDFFMTTQRYAAVSFTSPIFFTPLKLHFKKRHADNLTWNAYFKALTIDVWVVILGLILITPLLLTLIRYRRRDNFFAFLFEHYSYVWGIYCQQGVPVCPQGISPRIIYLSILMSAMVTLGAYSGSMISTLTVSSDSTFNTMDEFVEGGSHKLIVLDRTLVTDLYKFTDERMRMKMMSLLKPEHSLPQSIHEAFYQVCREKVAFFTVEATKTALLNRIPCEISSVQTGVIGTAGMIMPLGSKYRTALNHHLQQLKRIGLLQRLEHKYLRQFERGKSGHPPVTVERVVPILFVLAIGFLIAVIIFTVERNVHLSATISRDRKRRRVLSGKCKTFSFPT
ncbi:ionotropic receptor 107 [Diachasma alloeum]|uniref:Ionotropic receptor 107 n=2 Tax=Diachasma alloeum TaxID=454923 RepID=A0A4E0S3S1_9HYME|nr:ionotropic receptor 107 [Diachasma alloeum]